MWTTSACGEPNHVLDFMQVLSATHPDREHTLPELWFRHLRWLVQILTRHSLAEVRQPGGRGTYPRIRGPQVSKPLAFFSRSSGSVEDFDKSWGRVGGNETEEGPTLGVDFSDFWRRLILRRWFRERGLIDCVGFLKLMALPSSASEWILLDPSRKDFVEVAYWLKWTESHWVELYQVWSCCSQNLVIHVCCVSPTHRRAEY